MIHFMNSTEIDVRNYSTNFIPGNSSENIKFPSAIIKASVGLLVMLPNGLILTAIKRSRALKKPVYLLIAHLAVSDMLLGLLCVVRPFLDFIPFAKGRICQLMLGSLVISGGSSVSGILLLTIERYLSVRHPSLSTQNMTRGRVIKALAITWIFWIMYGGLGLTLSWNQRLPDTSLWNCSFGSDIYNNHYQLSLVILFLINQITMWYFQLKTLKVAKFFLIPAADRLRKRGSLNSVVKNEIEEKSTSKESETGETRSTACDEGSVDETAAEKLKHSRRQQRRHSAPLLKRESLKSDHYLNIPRNHICRSPFASLTSIVGELGLGNMRRYSSVHDAEKMKRLLKRSQQMSKLVFSIMGSYSLCWWPFMTALGVYSICPEHCNIDLRVFNILSVFIILNSFSNAFIYAAKSKDFRLAFKNIFRCQRMSNLSFNNHSNSLPRLKLSCEHIA